MDRAAAAGALLAERHRQPARPDPDVALAGYAETPRVGDWTLRSALVRLAQQDPVRAGAVLELIRRCDGALQPFGRVLERTTVWCDRTLTLATVDDATTPRHPDARATDLARLARSDPAEFEGVLAAYAAEVELDVADEERAAVPLLVVALDLDELADLLAGWAASGPDDPPLAAVDDACRRAFAGLEALGVPRETRPPGAGRSVDRRRPRT